jgi:hypothetical protein
MIPVSPITSARLMSFVQEAQMVAMLANGFESHVA